MHRWVSPLPRGGVGEPASYQPTVTGAHPTTRIPLSVRDKIWMPISHTSRRSQVIIVLPLGKPHSNSNSNWLGELMKWKYQPTVIGDHFFLFIFWKQCHVTVRQLFLRSDFLRQQFLKAGRDGHLEQQPSSQPLLFHNFSPNKQKGPVRLATICQTRLLGKLALFQTCSIFPQPIVSMFLVVLTNPFFLWCCYPVTNGYFIMVLNRN